MYMARRRPLRASGEREVEVDVVLLVELVGVVLLRALAAVERRGPRHDRLADALLHRLLRAPQRPLHALLLRAPRALQLFLAHALAPLLLPGLLRVLHVLARHAVHLAEQVLQLGLHVGEHLQRGQVWVHLAEDLAVDAGDLGHELRERRVLRVGARRLVRAVVEQPGLVLLGADGSLEPVDLRAQRRRLRLFLALGLRELVLEVLERLLRLL
mmetsp:Transcript_22348/g.65890  ORF Transcript_22348/g.65890 Transcript_22348/m.65890 type:complete len:213 (+) Transcript_22348:267-905(+)